MRKQQNILYIKYIAMRERCVNKLHPAYKRYWLRGIKCLWNNVEEFILDMWNTYSEWLTIDRIDINWDYCKENCRRITQKEQCNNRRSNRNITYNGITRNFWERVKELWIPRTTLQWRLYRWRSLERAFNKA